MDADGASFRGCVPALEVDHQVAAAPLRASRETAVHLEDRSARRAAWTAAGATARIKRKVEGSRYPPSSEPYGLDERHADRHRRARIPPHLVPSEDGGRGSRITRARDVSAGHARGRRTAGLSLGNRNRDAEALAPQVLSKRDARGHGVRRHRTRARLQRSNSCHWPACTSQRKRLHRNSFPGAPGRIRTSDLRLRKLCAGG